MRALEPSRNREQQRLHIQKILFGKLTWVTRKAVVARITPYQVTGARVELLVQAAQQKIRASARWIRNYLCSRSYFGQQP